jgi:hypothetical protein
MPDTQLALLQRYLPWRRYVEVGYWIVAMLFGATINSVVAWFDVQRAHLDFAPWQPAVWEWSSGLVMLVLIPVVLALTVASRWSSAACAGTCPGTHSPA